MWRDVTDPARTDHPAPIQREHHVHLRRLGHHRRPRSAPPGSSSHLRWRYQPMHGPRTLTPIARLATAGSLALAAAFASAGTVAAYPSPASTATITSTCATVAPGGSCTVTYTLVDSSSQPVSGAPVTFSLTGLSTASSATSATTNGSGEATITFNGRRVRSWAATPTAARPAP